MSDWQVGDLAVCVSKSGAWRHGGTGPFNSGPKAGHVCTVRAVGAWAKHTILWFNEWPGSGLGCSYGASSFRKIRPDSHEGNVEDWNLILETTKRKVRA